MGQEKGYYVSGGPKLRLFLIIKALCKMMCQKKINMGTKKCEIRGCSLQQSTM